MIHRGRLGLLVILVAAIVAAEWLRNPRPVVAWAEWGCAVAAAALLFGRGFRANALALLLALLALTITLSQRRFSAIERRWPQERESRVTAASQHLQGDLHAALGRADRLAEIAAHISAKDRAAAFHELQRITPGGRPEMGVVIFDADGGPWAWAGRHRLAP